MADIEKVIKALERCESDEECTGCTYEEKCWSKEEIHLGSTVRKDAIELLKSKPDIDKIVKELDDTSKQYEPRPFESIDWVLRCEGIMIGLEIAQYVVKGEPIPDEF